MHFIRSLKKKKFTPDHNITENKSTKHNNHFGHNQKTKFQFLKAHVVLF